MDKIVIQGKEPKNWVLENILSWTHTATLRLCITRWQAGLFHAIFWTKTAVAKGVTAALFTWLLCRAGRPQRYWRRKADQRENGNVKQEEHCFRCWLCPHTLKGRGINRKRDYLTSNIYGNGSKRHIWSFDGEQAQGHKASIRMPYW